MSQTPAPAPRPVSRRHAEHVSGAVYGTIVATAVVAASAGPAAAEPAHIIGLVLGSSAALWLAHVYSRWVALAMENGRQATPEERRQLAKNEWPMLQSSIPIVLALVPGKLGWMSVPASLWLAVGVGVAALVAWGVRIGVLEDQGPMNVARNAVISGSFGLIIVVLKAWVTH